MNFASDNQGPAHPRIIEALQSANEGYAASYGGDLGYEYVRDRLRDIFEAPEAEVFLVPTGTAANALILSSLVRPWSEIYCAYDSHIRHDECNAVEFFSGGARITYVGSNDVIDPDALRVTIETAAPHDIHNAQPGAVSLVQTTDLGRVLSLDEIAAVSAVARRFGLPVHMDGARFANALVALGCNPADMSWKAGVDALTFGATKNGCCAVEAAIFFDASHAREFELRRKRGGHLFSKHRFLSAQMTGYLDDDHWLATAKSANQTAQRLFAGISELPRSKFLVKPDANLAFVELPRAAHARAVAGGANYEITGDVENGPPDELLLSRFVVDWSATEGQVDELLSHLRG